MENEKDEQHVDHAELPSREELERLRQMDAEPLDLEALERDGIIEKRGSWYLLKGELPEKASRRAAAAKDSPQGVMVKFRHVKGYR